MSVSPVRPAEPARKRFRAGPLLKWAGTIALGGFVLSKTNVPAILRVASGANRGLLAIAVGLYVTDRVAAAHRWRILYVAFGHRLGLWRALCIYLQSAFLGAALPATVGGDIIRARMVATDRGSFPHALSSVVVERLLGTLAVVVAAALGLILFGPKITWTATVPFLTVAAGIVGAGTALIFAPAVPDTVVARVRGWWRKPVVFLVEVHERVRGYSRRPGVLAVSTGIAFGQQYLLTFINWLVARALGLPLELTSILWMWPFVMLAVRLPISFLGFGVREAVLFGFFAGAGLSAESAVSLGILSGLLDLLFIGIGGLLLLVAPSRPRDRGDEMIEGWEGSRETP